jgi:hypothetical protein
LLWKLYEAGAFTPAPVELGPMRENASDVMRAVAADIAIGIGLARAAGSDRPVPYAASFCSARLGWDPKSPRARRALDALTKVEVIVCAGSLRPINGRRYGTKLYREPLPVVAGVAAERVDVAADRRDRATPGGDRRVKNESASIELTDEPAMEAVDDGAVNGAEAAVPDHVGVIAAGNGAGQALEHDRNSTPVSGDSGREFAVAFASPEEAVDIEYWLQKYGD